MASHRAGGAPAIGDHSQLRLDVERVADAKIERIAAHVPGDIDAETTDTPSQVLLAVEGKIRNLRWIRRGGQRQTIAAIVARFAARHSRERQGNQRRVGFATGMVLEVRIRGGGTGGAIGRRRGFGWRGECLVHCFVLAIITTEVKDRQRRCPHIDLPPGAGSLRLQVDHLAIGNEDLDFLEFTGPVDAMCQ